MAKTIKQIADELGVSKTAVRKKIENLGLQSSLRKNGNQFAIDERQETLIKSAFGENESQTENRKSVSEKTETLQLVSDVVSVLKEQLSEKDKQLEAKDKQIEQLNARLAESQKLIDQQQQLQAMTEQKIKLLEQKEEQEQKAAMVQKSWWQFWK